MKKLRILELDPYLQPYEGDLLRRMQRLDDRLTSLLAPGQTLQDFANGHLYYGFHQLEDGWVYREWAPAAERLSLVGDFNGWDKKRNPMRPLGNGNWEIFIPGRDALQHESFVKVWMRSQDREFDRIPLYIRRAVQDPDTHDFSGQIWNPPQPYWWRDEGFRVNREEPLLIYESHVGMAVERHGVGTYLEFAKDVLPRVKADGYNTVQLMAVMEHPYYASFGYQVSNFFAPSSRFGTPEELKELIDTAHGMGIAVLLDIVHSHAADNAREGLGQFDGTDYQFFHAGPKGSHPAWGTKLFDYGKPQVLHFLLTNVKYWMDEFHFDGFRFDGVTSMLYHDHGLGTAFDSYEKYFSPNTDVDAVTYLQLANRLIKEVRPDAVSIAEDMSGLPGIALPLEDGGVGFDYRLSMGVPDFWVKTAGRTRDEDWSMGRMWHELTTRRPGEANVGYCESHDQALVGDKTLIFWLADQEMYWSMSLTTPSLVIDRAVALHKMIRLVTCALAGEGYLNFMGNEFGHPEWIDFPREGNNNSYQYARRQWSLGGDPQLRYKQLGDFDKAMLALIRQQRLIGPGKVPVQLYVEEQKKLLAFEKGGCVFLFNFHPEQALEGFRIPIHARYRGCTPALDTNNSRFGGFAQEPPHAAVVYDKTNYLEINLPARSAQVWRLSQ